MEIKDLENLVRPLLKDGQKLVSTQCKNLLSAGENYGSVMIQVEITLRDENGQNEEIVHCVAKTCPPPGFLWEIFNTKVTFKKEIALYHQVIPLLNNFGREHGIDPLISFVADCEAARVSLDPDSDEVDENAVLLLKNLKIEGYEVGDRFIGFDLDTAKLLLKDLAILHATVIAYKLEKPDEFRTDLLPYLSKHPVVDFDKNTEDHINEGIIQVLSRNSECVPHLSKLKSLMENFKEVMRKQPDNNEIFTTLTHNDYWMNNTMVKCESGKAISNKIVDFQIIEHTSLANDVIFFLYTSVELEALENHMDDLVGYYYEEFIGILKKLGSDVSAYTFQKMLDEFALIATNVQLLHILFMLRPIMTLKGKAKELSNMDMEDILVDDTSLHENYFKKMHFTLLDFAKRGWL